MRSATAERAADVKGRVSDEMVEMYRILAKGGSGLIITGHAYVRPDGRTNPTMTGVHDDDMIPGLSRLAKTVHKNSDARVFLQINHAGRATYPDLINTLPVAPSAVPIRLSGQQIRELAGDEIEELIECYANAVRRAMEAGFDGVQLHAAHGYLLAQFLSPYTNRREDEWGGNAENRGRFLLRIIAEIRKLDDDFPLAVKINSEDLVPEGFSLTDFTDLCNSLVSYEIEFIEVSGGIPESAGKIIRKGINKPEKEGYFRAAARALKDSGINIPVVSVGGYRSKHVVQDVLNSGDADMVSLCRPLITEPDLPEKWRTGESEVSRCISCNSCLKAHDEMTHCVYWLDKAQKDSTN